MFFGQAQGYREKLRQCSEPSLTNLTGNRTTEAIHTPAPENKLVGAITAAHEQSDVAVGSYPRKDDVPNRVKITGEEPEIVAAVTAFLRERVETVSIR
jgi:hypothetical protein